MSKPFLKFMKKTPLSLAIMGILSVSTIAQAQIIANGDVTDGATYPYWEHAGAITVGDTSEGELKVSDGSSIMSDGAVLGGTANGLGISTISGENSAWTMSSGLMQIGLAGTGVLNISDGASVSNTLGYVGYATGSTGVINVSGSNSLLDNKGSLYIGYAGNGMLNVTKGATVNTTHNSSLGQDAGSYGRLTIDGAGSTFNAANSVVVAWDGTADIYVTNGGQLNSNSAMLGVNVGSVGGVALSGANSQWNNSGAVMVGYGGSGTLTIGNNAELNTTEVIVANSIGSDGSVNIGIETGSTPVAAGYINATKLILGDGDAMLAFNHINTDYVFTPVITGNGNVSFYNGTTIFDKANDYSGGTAIYGGVLKAGAANAFSAQSDYYIMDGSALLDLAGYDQTLSSLYNSGVVNFSGAGNTTLTISGNYVGNDGLINMGGILANDASVTDKLVIQGDSSGTSYVSVSNMGGRGAQTLNGIELIKVEGTSDGEFIQQGRIAAGAYDYTLARGTDANAANWYLTSIGDDSVEQQRPEASSYGVNLVAANTLFVTSLHDRLGETQYIDALTGEKKVTSLWLRNEGGHNRSRDTSGQLSTQSNRYVVQLGGDIAQWSNDAQNRLHLGLMAGYANNKGTTESRQSGYSSRATVDGYSAGVYATWYANDADKSGLYVDSWAQYGWFNNTVSGQELQREEYKSKGMTASVETGYTFKLGENPAKNTRFFIQPKAQVTWMGVKADDHKENNGTYVTGEGNNNIQTRLGARLFMNGYSTMDKGKDRLFQPFVEANWIHNSKDFGATLDGVTIKQDGAANIGELKVGLEAQINKKVNLWSNVAQQVGDKGYSDTSVMLGGKFNF